MQTIAVYFHPLGAVSAPFSSDTLFGAVCWGIQVLGLKDALAGWLNSAAGPPFAFSAAFPAWFDPAGQPLLRCYPRPLNFAVQPEEFGQLSDNLATRLGLPGKSARFEASRRAKSFKGAAWFSEAILKSVLQGRLNARQVLTSLSEDTSPYIQSGSILLSAAEANQLEAAGYAIDRRLMAESAVQHNQIDRWAGSVAEGMLFYDLETRFQPGTGLWALVCGDADDLEHLVKPALRYLGDTGLGANRSSGNGQFKITFGSAPDLPSPAVPHAILALSRYLPAAGEQFSTSANPLAYRLTTLRPKREAKFHRPQAGVETPPIYKRPLRLFEPGSVFPFQPGTEIIGRVVEVVSPEEGGPVYQSGSALYLSLGSQEGHDAN